MNQCFRQLLLMQTESDILFSVLKREPTKCRSNIAGNIAISEAGKICYVLPKIPLESLSHVI